MSVSISIDVFGEREAVSSGFGQANQLFEPCGASSLEVYAGIEAFHCGVDCGVDGEFVAAGVNAEFEIAGQTEVIDRIGDGGNIKSEFVLELFEISLIVDALIKTATEFGRNGLDWDAFVGNGGKNDEKFEGSLCAVRLVHRYLGDEVSFFSGVHDDAIDFSGLLHCGEVLLRGFSQKVGRDAEGFRESLERNGGEEFGMAIHELIDFVGRGGLADEVRYIDGVEIAGGDEASDCLRVDVIGIAKIRMVPAQGFDCRIGSLANSRGFRADDRMFAVGLVPDWRYVDTFLLSHDAGAKLSFCLVREAVACSDRILTQSKTFAIHVAPWKSGSTSEARTQSSLFLRGQTTSIHDVRQSMRNRVSRLRLIRIFSGGSLSIKQTSQLKARNGSRMPSKKHDSVNSHRTMQVVDHVRVLIENGTLKPGDKIPPERELARSLKISRASLRTGIGHLAAMGVMKIRHGVGTFVEDGPPDFGKASLSLMGALHGFQSWQMFEARLILEGALAALAAERGKEEHHAVMAEEVAEMFASLNSPSEYLIHDVLFHRIIAKASGNPILAAIMETVTSTMYDVRRKTVERSTDLRESAEMHRKIYRAIRSRNSEEARKLMIQHLRMAQTSQGMEVPADKKAPDNAPRKKRGKLAVKS